MVRLQTGETAVRPASSEELTRRGGIDWQVPRVSSLGALRRSCVEYTVPGGIAESLHYYYPSEGRTPVPATRTTGGVRQSPDVNGDLSSVQRIPIGWRNVSLPAVIRQLRLSQSSIRLPGRKARPFAAR